MKPLISTTLLFLIFSVFSIKTNAQVPTVNDCLGAIPICQEQYTEPTPYIHSGNGNYPDEIYQPPTQMCIANENNGVWYIFTARQDGYFRFMLTPHDVATDFDWSMFDLTNATCADIYDNTTELVISSNTWGDFYNNVPTGANSAISGGTAGNCNGPGTDGGPPVNDDVPVVENGIYALYVSNWSSSGYGYDIDFSGSTGDILDDDPPIMLDVNAQEFCDSAVISCHFNENILCNSVGPEDFQIFGPGGPFTVVDVVSPSCEVGAEYGIDFEITFTPPLQSGGYTLYLEPHELGSSVTDLCGNSAEIGIANFQTVSNYEISFNNTDITCHDYDDGIINASITPPEGVTVEYTLGGVTNSTGIFTDLPEGTYTVTITTSTGCTGEDETVIINPPQAFADAGADTVICGFPTFEMQAIESPVGTGTWTSGTPEVSFSNENMYNTNANIPFGIHTLTWTVDNGICGTFVDEMQITRYPTNTLAGDDDGACETSGYLLEGNDPFPGTGVWTCSTTGVTFENASSYNTMAYGISNGSYTFTWQTDYGVCGTLSDDVVITAYETPTEAIVSTENQTICSDNTTLLANYPSIGTPEWTTESGATFVTQNSAFTIVENLAEGENKFFWVITNGTCPPEIDSVSIFRDLEPTVSDAGAEIATCVDFTTLAGNIPEIGTGEWTSAGAATIVNSTLSNSDVLNLELGETIFVWTISNGVCEPSVSEVLVTRHESLTIAQAGDDQEICNLNSTLEANEAEAGIGTWTTENSAIIVNENLANSTVIDLEIGENVFVWEISGEHCEGSSDTLIIITDAIPPTPSTAILPQVVEQCEILNIVPPTATDNCAGEISATTLSPLSYTEQGTYEITWAYTDQNGNQTIQTQIFVVEDVTDPIVTCDTTVTVMIDTTNQNRIYFNEGTELDPLEISDNCEVVGIVNNFNSLGTLAGEEFEVGENYITWTISDIANNKSTCTTKLQVIINPEDLRDCDEDGIPNYLDTDHCVVVPEAISPNGNGKNDVLIIEGLEQFPLHKLQIFNRWGSKVYEASPYNNDWDGSNIFGATIGKEKLPVGTYYYTLFLDDTYEPLRGFIYIVK